MCVGGDTWVSVGAGVLLAIVVDSITGVAVGSGSRVSVGAWVLVGFEPPPLSPPPPRFGALVEVGRSPSEVEVKVGVKVNVGPKVGVELANVWLVIGGGVGEGSICTTFVSSVSRDESVLACCKA